MPNLFQVFELTDDGIRTKFECPQPLAHQAKRVATFLSVSTGGITHAELVELAGLSQRLIQNCRTGVILIPIGSTEDDNDANILSGLADDTAMSGEIELKAYPHREYQAWHLMSAYSLLMLDRAAICAAQGDMHGALDALCLSMESNQNSTLWWTGQTIENETAGAGSRYAQMSKRVQALPELKAYAANRWKRGRDDGRPWKSKRSCAIAIAVDVQQKAKELSWEMTGAEPERTIYKWLREQAD